jgi:hypothetical protein
VGAAPLAENVMTVIVAMAVVTEFDSDARRR